MSRSLEYVHVCKDRKYDPELLGQVINQAISLFKNRERGRKNFRFKYDDFHPLTLGNLEEIGLYIDKIWADEEIITEVE